MPLPLLIILFLVTFAIMGFMGWLFYTMAKSEDTKEEGKLLSHNQMRLMGWLAAILIVLVAVVIEYFVLVR